MCKLSARSIDIIQRGYILLGNDGMEVYNGNTFSAVDRDNDNLSKQHCARDKRKGGWWHYRCGPCNINGLYKTAGYKGNDAMFYAPWRDKNALKSTQMMIQPK